jgi:nucleoid-associated protein YgaU
LAVILMLLITFGVVLVRRLGGLNDPAATAAVDDNDQDSSPAGENPADDDCEAEAPAAGPNKLKVLVAKPASSQTPRLPPPAVSQFAVVCDEEVPGTDAGCCQVSPPALQPPPRPPAWNDPYVLSGSSAQQMDASQAGRMLPVSTAVSARDRQLYGPLQNQTAQAAANDMAQVAPMPGGLRSLGPPRQTPRQSYGSGYEYPVDGGHTAGSSAAWQAPAWRQTAPPTYPAQSQQAQTLPVPGCNSVFGSPYGAQNLRNVDGDYEVQPNDSYWVISQKLYGSGAYFKALAQHNRGRVPREDRLDVGEVISAPSLPELEKAYPDLCPKPSRRETVRNRASLVSTRTPYVGGRIYLVEEGDTLFDIARYELGKASRWVEILELNRHLVGDDADYISPGMQLVLPHDEPSARVTQRPRSVYQP